MQGITCVTLWNHISGVSLISVHNSDLPGSAFRHCGCNNEQNTNAVSLVELKYCSGGRKTINKIHGVCDTVIETKEKKRGRGIRVREKVVAVMGRTLREPH